VINTLNIWDIKIDEIFFLGGSEKAQILRAFGADIFFDDQDIHLDIASNIVPSAKVINEKIEAFEK
jgi:5'-nucleotidase